MVNVTPPLAGYVNAGAWDVWVVDRRRRGVSVYRPMMDASRLSEGGELDGGGVVPGFRRRVSEIFA
ncbi:MAG TPA: hypothetical protein VF668_11690 [Pyrinomonadaceae bacterium]